MKKIFAILMGLLFFGSVFSSAVLGCCMDSITATPNKVKVGELITVECNGFCNPVPLMIEGTGNASFVSLVLVDNHNTYTYRATKPGIIRFFNSDCPVKSNDVTITSNSYPMQMFMKMLGLGKYKE